MTVRQSPAANTHTPALAIAPLPGVALAMPQKRVLVATALDASSAAAVQRADVMARALGAELFVVHVLPPVRWAGSLFPKRRFAQAAQVAAAREAAHRYCEAMLAKPFLSSRILIEQGDVAETVDATAERLGASLVVVHGGPGGSARSRVSRVVQRLLRRVERPVLVARDAMESNGIVAATDFSDGGFPALTQASAIGARLHAPVTFVHNVDPFASLVAANTFGVGPALINVSLHDAEARKAAHLRYVASTLGSRIEAVILSRESATEAILEVARARDADVVVVGTHKRRGLTRFAGRHTAETVVASARRSVLTVPIDTNTTSAPLAA